MRWDSLYKTSRLCFADIKRFIIIEKEIYTISYFYGIIFYKN